MMQPVVFVFHIHSSWPLSHLHSLFPKQGRFPSCLLHDISAYYHPWHSYVICSSLNTHSCATSMWRSPVCMKGPGSSQYMVWYLPPRFIHCALSLLDKSDYFWNKSSTLDPRPSILTLSKISLKSQIAIIWLSIPTYAGNYTYSCQQRGLLTQCIYDCNGRTHMKVASLMSMSPAQN